MSYRTSYYILLMIWSLGAPLAGTSQCVFAQPNQQQPTATFEQQVLPILRDRCFQCHSGNKPRAELDLTTRSGLLRGGWSGAAVRARAAESSLLWERIAADEMPAKGPPLTRAQKGIIRRWINDGAVGPEDAPAASAAEHPAIDDRARSFWSFQSPRRPPLPPAAADSLCANPIDSFVLAKLAEHGLGYSETATRQTLIRRVHYDLLGLPPTPAQVRQFVADDRPQAYQDLVERLLADPRYGERWGRHWLDVAGYADSAGILNEDRVLPLAYRYRDYVIRALNQDKPYDRFLLEQLAGDELYDYWHHYSTAAQLPDHVIDGLIATGFLRCAADSSRPDFSSIKNADALYFYPTLNDTLQIVSTSVLGLTVQCARCHDHMYDPIPQRDYYRMQAVFMGALRPSQWIPQMERRLKIATQTQEQQAAARNQELDKQVQGLKQQLVDLRRQYAEKRFAQRLAKLPDAIRDAVRQAFAITAKERTPQQQRLVDANRQTLKPDEKQLSQELAADYPHYERQRQALADQIQSIERRRIVLEEIRALYDLPGTVATPLLRRGDPLTPGPTVSPGALNVLELAASFQWQPPAADTKTSGRRLAFARWLTDERHPLTARVMVNRLWLHHFGEGLVATPGDFGRSGAAPSHPKLLDWLAREFAENGWSIKRMHRLILTSRAYRQQSGGDAERSRQAERVDPENRLLWRQRLRRLEAEALRDSVWHTAGTLSSRMFGSPVPVKRQPDGEVRAANAQGPPRRSVYLQILRLTPLTMLQNFDQPVMETNCLLRSRSTVSPQALTLLNSDAMVTAAIAFADRILKEDPENPAAQAVWLAYSRPPLAAERRHIEQFIARQAERYQAGKRQAAGTNCDKDPAEQAFRRAVADLCHMLLSSNEFLYVD